MKSKTFIVLLVVCAVLGGITYWQFNKENGGAARDAAMGEELLADLSVNDIAAVRVIGPENSAALKKETVWEVENRFGYPADFSRITDLVKKLRSVAVGRSFKANDDARSRLALHPPDKDGVDDEARGTRVVLENADGKTLADVLVGNPREASAGAGGHYLMRLPGDTVYLVDKSFSRLETEPREWLVKELVDASSADIREVQYRAADGGEPVYTLARPEKGKDPAFQVRPEGFSDREIKKSEINTLFGALSGFQIENVADPADKPADDSFRHVFEYRLFDGSWYKAFLGEAVPGDDDDNYYVKVRAGFTSPPAEETDSEGDDASTEAAEDDPEAQKKAEEEKKKTAEERRQKQAELKEKALELDEKLQSWTYIVPEWRYNKFKTDVEGLFEEPAAAESEEAALDN